MGPFPLREASPVRKKIMPSVVTIVTIAVFAYFACTAFVINHNNNNNYYYSFIAYFMHKSNWIYVNRQSVYTKQQLVTALHITKMWKKLLKWNTSYIQLLFVFCKCILLQLLFITSSQYSDIVIERSVTKLCGYPLCGNALTAVSR